MKAPLLAATLLWLFATAAITARAQESTPPVADNANAGADPATAAQPEKQPETQPDKQPDASASPKNDRIFMVIPNYTTVEKPTDFVPISTKEKFKLGAEDAFDPYSFPLAAIVAGIAQADNDDATWGQGLKGYGLRFAAGYADTVTGSFMTTGVFPALLHEDPRYFRKGMGSFWLRSGYAIKRLFVTRTDSGGTTFNFSEFGGNAAAGAISLTYHSADDRTFSNFLSDWGTQISIDFVANQLKEFWPDMRHKILHR